MKLLRGFLNLLLVSVAITAVFFPVAVFVHEGTHYVMYTIEGIPVTSFHVLDQDSLENGRYGYVTTTERITIWKPDPRGSRKHRWISFFSNDSPVLPLGSIQTIHGSPVRINGIEKKLASISCSKYVTLV